MLFVCFLMFAVHKYLAVEVLSFLLGTDAVFAIHPQSWIKIEVLLA